VRSPNFLRERFRATAGPSPAEPKVRYATYHLKLHAGPTLDWPAPGALGGTAKRRTVERVLRRVREARAWIGFNGTARRLPIVYPTTTAGCNPEPDTPAHDRTMSVVSGWFITRPHG